MSVRNTAPEQKMIYHNILKSEIIDMLYGKGLGKDIAEKVKIEDKAIGDIARRIGDIVWDFDPETTLYKAIEYNLDGFKHRYSKETQEILGNKLKDMKERLKIRSDEDFTKTLNDISLAAVAAKHLHQNFQKTVQKKF